MYPGWGQLQNKSYVKALAVFVSETALLGMIYRESREASQAYEAHLAAPDEVSAARLYAEYEEHFEKQEALTWWTAALVLLSVADAYVDANLATFEDEFGEPGSRVSLSVEPGAFSRGGFVCVSYGF